MTPNLTWETLQSWLVEALTRRRINFQPEGQKGPGHGKVDYQSVLVSASKSMIRVKKPEHLIRMIVKTIDGLLKTTHTAVLLYSQRKGAYILIDSKGKEGHKIPIGYVKLMPDNPLIRVFSERRSPLLDGNRALIYGKIENALHDDTLIIKNHGIKEKLLQIREEMKRLRSEICVPSYFKRQLVGVLVLGKKTSGEKFTQEEVDFFVALANDTSMAIANAQLIENLESKVKEIAYLYERERQLFVSTTIALAAAIDARDPYTHGHTERVTHYALAIAEELIEHKEDIDYKSLKETLHIAALLHDIGKIGVPDYILNKSDKLTHQEFEKVKEHPDIGASILNSIKELSDVIECVRYHQEWFDGKGYPGGLKGDEIPLIARIISVADAFDAITTDRPYRKKRGVEFAVEEIKSNSGTQFDPQVVEAFLKAYHRGTLVNGK